MSTDSATVGVAVSISLCLFLVLSVCGLIRVRRRSFRRRWVSFYASSPGGAVNWEKYRSDPPPRPHAFEYLASAGSVDSSAALSEGKRASRVPFGGDDGGGAVDESGLGGDGSHGVPGLPSNRDDVKLDSSLNLLKFAPKFVPTPRTVASTTALSPGVTYSFTINNRQSDAVITVGVCGAPFPPFSSLGRVPVSAGVRSDTGRACICANDSDMVDVTGSPQVRFGAGETISLSLSLEMTDHLTPSVVLVVRKEGSPPLSVNISSLQYDTYPLFAAITCDRGATITLRTVDAHLTKHLSLVHERSNVPITWEQYVEPSGAGLTFGIDGLHNEVMTRGGSIEFRNAAAPDERSVTCNRALLPGHGVLFTTNPQRGSIVMLGLCSRPYPCIRLPGFQHNSIAVRSDSGKLVLHFRPASPGLPSPDPVVMDYMPGGFSKGDEVEMFVTKSPAPGSPALLVMYKNRTRLPPVDISSLGWSSGPLFPVVGATKGARIQYLPLETSSSSRRSKREATAVCATLTWFDYRISATHKFIAVPEDVSVTDSSRRVLFRRPVNQAGRCIFSQRALTPNVTFSVRVVGLSESGYLAIGLCTLPYPNYTAPGQHCHSVGVVSTTGKCLLGTGKMHDRFGGGQPCFPDGFGAGDQLDLSIQMGRVKSYCLIVLNDTLEAKIDITELHPSMLLLFPAIACNTEADLAVTVTTREPSSVSNNSNSNNNNRGKSSLRGKGDTNNGSASSAKGKDKAVPVQSPPVVESKRVPPPRLSAPAMIPSSSSASSSPSSSSSAGGIDANASTAMASSSTSLVRNANGKGKGKGKGKNNIGSNDPQPPSLVLRVPLGNAADDDGLESSPEVIPIDAVGVDNGDYDIQLPGGGDNNQMHTGETGDLSDGERSDSSDRRSATSDGNAGAGSGPSGSVVSTGNAASPRSSRGSHSGSRSASPARVRLGLGLESDGLAHFDHHGGSGVSGRTGAAASRSSTASVPSPRSRGNETDDGRGSVERGHSPSPMHRHDRHMHRRNGSRNNASDDGATTGDSDSETKGHAGHDDDDEPMEPIDPSDADGERAALRMRAQVLESMQGVDTTTTGGNRVDTSNINSNNSNNGNSNDNHGDYGNHEPMLPRFFSRIPSAAAARSETADSAASARVRVRRAGSLSLSQSGARSDAGRGSEASSDADTSTDSDMPPEATLSLSRHR